MRCYRNVFNAHSPGEATVHDGYSRKLIQRQQKGIPEMYVLEVEGMIFWEERHELWGESA